MSHCKGLCFRNYLFNKLLHFNLSLLIPLSKMNLGHLPIRQIQPCYWLALNTSVLQQLPQLSEQLFGVILLGRKGLTYLVSLLQFQPHFPPLFTLGSGNTKEIVVTSLNTLHQFIPLLMPFPLSEMLSSPFFTWLTLSPFSTYQVSSR